MKKLLILLTILAMVGVVQAVMPNNPEDWEGHVVSSGVGPGTAWGTWGSGSGTVGWFGGSPGLGGPATGSIAGTVHIQSSATNNYAHLAARAGIDPVLNWGIMLAFSHDNALTLLPDNGNNRAELSFRARSSGGGAGLIKLEFYATADPHPTQVALGVAEWNPTAIASTWTTYTFSAYMPAATNYISPVLGVSGIGGAVDFDDVSLTVPEPITIGLLGLGGLFLRRRKA